MNEIISLFKKGVPRQKKVYQAYMSYSEVKNLSYVNFKNNNIPLIEIKEYYHYLYENQINNIFEYLKQYLYMTNFSKLKKVYKQLNELSDCLSEKYNKNKLHGQVSKDNCLLIINKINGLKQVLAYKNNYSVSDIENITLFESVVGHLLNPKNNNFSEEDLVFLLSNLSHLYGKDRNGRNFNDNFCKQVEKAKITRDREKLEYFLHLYQHIVNIKAIPMDNEYLMSLFDLKTVVLDNDVIDRKLLAMQIHPKTGNRIVKDYVLSIDNDETKKIDDAFSIEKVGGGYLIGIHIADVYSLGYFEEDSLDVNQKNNVNKKDASLTRNKERNAVSLYVFLDNNGIIVKYRMLKTTLINRSNLIYDDIPKILGSKEVEPALKENVLNLVSVYTLLENSRFTNSPTIKNLAYLIVSKLMVLCSTLYSFEFSKRHVPAIYLVGDKDIGHYSLEDLEFYTGFEGYNCYARVTSPIIDRTSLINQFFIQRCLFQRMSEENKYKLLLKLRPVVDKMNKNKEPEKLF